MSLRRVLDTTIYNRFGLGHITWPTFGMPVKIGDAAHDGLRGFEFAGLGNLAQRYGLNLEDYQYAEGPPVEVELKHEVDFGLKAGLSGRLGLSPKRAALNLSFEGQGSFYMFVPKARICEIGDVESFARDIKAKDQGQGGVGRGERIVYKTIVAEGEGVLLFSRSHGAKGQLLASPTAHSRCTFDFSRRSGDVAKIEINEGSAVFAFSVFRLALGRRHYVILPRE